MKNTQIFIAALVLFVFVPWHSTIVVAETETLTTIVLQVHEKGFTDAEGKVFDGAISIPEESRVKIVFEYANSLGDDHEFALMLPSDEEIYSDMLSEKNKRVEIVFVSGKAGERYDIYCIIDCEGMDNLVDLILMAV